ncbi:MAG: sn-glycerol-3-phosphate ABC transporter ATP-binding protein UgpC [Gemmatimonadota bacterium]|nr:sn-glycerol-3-phosphate ABC transporter ATP-binding protein UgpC [Gemmatimonadota bacterium]
MASVRLEDVHKTYPNGHVAARGLDLSIEDGEFVVLVGPSGCGKSTALRIVAGLETPTEGRVWIGDRDCTEVPAQDRDIAMVFQSYALYPHMTIRDNMGFGLRMRRHDAAQIRERVERVAAALGLEEFLDRKPGQLSGGQRQRVALGRAIVREPQAFLFDEPLSNLDARLRVQTRAELRRMHRRLGATMVYVTHDQEEAMTLGDRVAVLNDGILQQYGAPLDVYRRPANRFVAGFVGSPSMNFFEVELRRGDGGPRLAGDALDRALPPGLAERAGAGPFTLGVRPHDVELSPSPETRDGAPEADARGRVDVVEPLGAATLVHVRLSAAGSTDGPEVRAIVPPERAPAEGAWVDVQVRADGLHLFDQATGRRAG